MQRIIVVGTSGSGKTTLAEQIAHQLNIPHIELDALHWQDDWTEATLEVFRQRVQQAITADTWVLDGNYRTVRDLTWTHADTLIWLDYPRALVMWRVFRRTLTRVLTREKLWGTNNHEGWRQSFFSGDSVIVWAWTTYNRRRQEYPGLLQQREHAHLKVLRFTSPHQTTQWLHSLC
jgi:adenylate kinase family enzyme